MATISIPAPARRRRRRAAPACRRPLALLPTAIVVLVVYLGCMLWTVRLSFSSSQAAAEARLGRLRSSITACSRTTAS